MPTPGDPPGYYEDPEDPSRIRYWTGQGWRPENHEDASDGGPPVSDNWQRRAFDAANNTHWLFTTTDDASPSFHQGPTARDPRRYHPSYGEALGVCSILLSMEGGAVFFAATGQIPWSWALLSVAPLVLGVGLAFRAAAWASKKNAGL